MGRTTKASINHSFRVTPDFNQDLMNYCNVHEIELSVLVRELLKNKIYALDRINLAGKTVIERSKGDV